MLDHHHLFKHGVAGLGVVTAHKEIVHDQFGTELDYSIHVQVRFADGSGTEFVHHRANQNKVGLLRVGDKVPVRYDANDHAKAVVDVPALEAAHTQRLAELKASQKHRDEERIARAQAEIAAQGEGTHRHHR